MTLALAASLAVLASVHFFLSAETLLVLSLETFLRAEAVFLAAETAAVCAALIFF